MGGEQEACASCASLAPQKKIAMQKLIMEHAPILILISDYKQLLDLLDLIRMKFILGKGVDSRFDMGGYQSNEGIAVSMKALISCIVTFIGGRPL